MVINQATDESPAEEDQRRIGVPVESLPKLNQEVTRLARRAKRLQLPEPKLTLIRREPWIQEARLLNPGTDRAQEKIIWVPASSAERPIDLATPARMVAVVDVSTGLIRLNGWRLGLIIHHPGGGEPNRVHSFGGFEKLRSNYLDQVPTCEHCGTNRERVKTYIVQHQDGRLTQVGSGCLQDFIGATSAISVAQWVNFYSGWNALDRDFLKTLWNLDPRFMPRVYSLEAVLGTTAAFTRQNGFASRQQASQNPQLTATADLVKEYGLSSSPEYQERVLPGGITAQDRDEGRRTLVLAKDRLLKLSDKELYGGRGDYELNLRNLVGNEFITDGQFGLAASLLPYIRRALAHDLEQAKIQQERTKSEWFGAIGDRLELELVLTGIREIEFTGVPPTGHHSYVNEEVLQTLNLHTFREPRGEATWFTAKPMPKDLIGQRIKIKGTVKAHKEFKGIKQTTLSRVTVLEPTIPPPTSPPGPSLT